MFSGKSVEAIRELSSLTKHSPPFSQGLLAQGSTKEHLSPVKPAGHMQVNSCAVDVQVAPFSQSDRSQRSD